MSVRTFAAALVMLVVCGTGIAFADDPGPAAQPGPSLAEVEAASNDPDLQATEPPRADLQAAEELPHRDLSREQAIDLLDSVFGSELQSPAGIFDELDVEKFYSDNVALIAAGDQPSGGGEGPTNPRPTLLEASIPLRTEDADGQTMAVDLSLEGAEGEIQPANPLVEIGIPSQLGEKISLPEAGVEIALAGAPAERAPTTIDQSVAAYPSVAPDTTFVVSPAPTGLETLTLLQSAEAPTSQTFNLTLPGGATLIESADGGAEVRSQAGEPLVKVRPPSALDANEAPVPAHLETTGNSITVTAEPSEESAFPILVDPMWESYTWYELTTTSFEGWDSFSNSTAFTTSHNGWQNEGKWNPGLQIVSGPGSISPGAQARWDYHVPRWGVDVNGQGQSVQPTSFIRRVIFEKLFFDVQAYAQQVEPDPFLTMYIWDEHNSFVDIFHHWGTEGNLSNMNYQYNIYNFPPPEENTDAKQASIELVSSQTHGQYRQVYVGLVGVELSDLDFPHFATTGAPSGWVNNNPAPISFSATDTGLGVYELRAWEPTKGGGFQNVGTHRSCTGGAISPCPRTWSASNGPDLDYDPSIMPQGEDWVKLTAVDPVGHLSQEEETPQAEVKVRVDHTAPEVLLSGNILEQEIVGTRRPVYDLRVDATDGTEVAPQSGVVKAEVKVDGKKITMPDESEWNPACVTRSCPLAAEWSLDASQYTEGTHEVEVRVTDGVGLTTAKMLMVKLQQSPPSLAVSGSITEQATLGSSRPHYKLALSASAEAGIEGSPPAPIFNSSLGSLGSGNGQLNTPADAAVDSKGNIWVADKLNNRIEKFNAAGEYLSKFGSSGTSNGKFNHPDALAIDSKGNIWVADWGNNRVQKFNEKGEYLSKFGTAGSGNGQFNGVEGIAVDSKGNVWVSDATRVQKFNESGTFQKVLGSVGSGSGQIGEPVGLDVGPVGNVWIADWGNNRISVFSESGTFIRQFGSEGTGDGQFERPVAVDVDSAGHVWVADQWGSRVEEFTETGEYVTRFGDGGSGEGEFDQPIGLVADTRGNLWVVDKGNDRVQRWNLASRQSEISTEITVDGKQVDLGSVSCISERCPVVREWTLTSSEYSAGQHTVVAKVTDGLGNTVSKATSIEVQSDTVKPDMEVTGDLVSAPKGWVEQNSYGLSASATDTGYGVTSLVFKIEGKEVASSSQVCADGGCAESLSKSVDMAPYSGGAHPAELVATDGAGNTATKKWTINVDPEGHVSTSEATATLEAVDATSSVNTVGAPKAEEAYEGTALGLGLEEVEGQLTGTGTMVPLVVSSEPSEGMEMKILEEGTFAVACSAETSFEEVEPEEPESSENSLAEEPCLTDTEVEEREEDAIEADSEGLASIEITPTDTSPEASENIVTEEAAAVAANTSIHVDSVIRPLYDGALMFQDIRDASAPEVYSWEVNLGEGQTLHLIDDQHVAVMYDDEHTAFSISAEPAHDAIGTSVPTKLSITEGNIVNLLVNHRPAEGQSGYVYPVISGVGWQGGFRSQEEPRVIQEPLNVEEEPEVEDGEELYVSPPEPASPKEAGVTDKLMLLRAGSNTTRHFFRWIRCEPQYHYGDPTKPTFVPRGWFSCGNPFTGEKPSSAESEIAFNFGFRGHYYVSPGNFVRHRGSANDEIECAKQHFDTEQGWFDPEYFIDPARRCVWWGKTKDGGGNEVGPGKHLTPFGEWLAGRGSPGYWRPYELGSALYIYSTLGGFRIEHHKTLCIDC